MLLLGWTKTLQPTWLYPASTTPWTLTLSSAQKLTQQQSGMRSLMYPPSESWPILIFFNGLGGHRLITAMTEGIARAHNIQILTIDKPSAGSSKCTDNFALPLFARTRWMHTALLAVLAHLQITRFAVLSHSNGLFYALYTLLHLPPSLKATSWTLSGPFVPHTISGSRALRLAAALPTPLPNALGTLMQAMPPVARVMWRKRETRKGKPPHERGYMHRYVNTACREAIMRRAIDESRVAMGQEALFCLHGEDSASSTTAGANASSPSTSPLGGTALANGCVWGLGPGATPAAILQGAFTRLAELQSQRAQGGLRIHVVYGADDGMVPVQGRVWLRGVLEAAGLLSDEGEGDADDGEHGEVGETVDYNAPWEEVPGAGHDDVLFLEAVIKPIMRRVRVRAGSAPASGSVVSEG
ncbi:Cellobiohydrolase I [Mycena sanguinolenta]|uniref:Cellobiohydrolase I n=1 Tax=Mycena sanguinolenta TaxID=230812 RepID=A0A8H6XE93_9AGAR|nr:Cellobiohydrolase I [Mycena sanguinolenta]